MSTGILTKLIPFSLALAIAWGSTDLYIAEQKNNAELASACMAVASNLPRNHSAHPCKVHFQSNQSWLSWLSGNSRSAHFQFLDLVELLHQHDAL
jgi:hypothetical protein